MSTDSITLRLATAQEIENWDELAIANPDGSNFLNSVAYGRLKSQFGWQQVYLVFTTAGGTVDRVALGLERSVPFFGRIWHIPRFPGTDTTTTAKYVEVLRNWLQLNAKDVFTVVFSPPIQVPDEVYATRPDYSDTTAPAEFAALGVVRRPSLGDVSTAMVNLEPSVEEINATFDRSCKKYLRRMEREGITVQEMPANEETYALMHELMRKVGGGKVKLNLRDPQYLETQWREFAKTGHGFFYAINDSDGNPALLNFTIIYGDSALTKDGGSERDRTVRGMSNLMYWHMMQDAKAKGAKMIDFFGVAPAWAQSNDDHPNYNLTQFKLSFARERTNVIGTFELVLKPAKHKLWKRIGERVAGKLHARQFSDIYFY